MRSGKTYFGIVQAIADAKKRGEEPYGIWASARIKPLVEEVAKMLGVEVTVVTDEHETLNKAGKLKAEISRKNKDTSMETTNF